ncbi:MAG: TetR-like C-terminal domain-containing protein [Nakamurella sp.]
MTGQKRPGGRSARVQQSVHRAVSELLAEGERAALTVPTVAVRAGVTPSTIHRRWGSLQDLLADVAAQRLRPEAPPLDTGSLRTDLVSWTRNYQEELASPDGRLFLRDVVVGSAGSGSACRCAAATREQMEVILRRADERGDAAPTAQDVVDHVISPIVYAILFDDTALDASNADALVDRLLTHQVLPNPVAEHQHPC